MRPHACVCNITYFQSNITKYKQSTYTHKNKMVQIMSTNNHSTTFKFINPNWHHNVPKSLLKPHEGTQTPWLIDFSGGFLSHQNTDSPQSVHCSFSPFWFSCQGNPTLRNSRNPFPCPTTENCVLRTNIWDVRIVAVKFKNMHFIKIRIKYVLQRSRKVLRQNIKEQ